MVLEKPKVGKAFKKDAKLVSEHIASLAEEQVTKLESDLNSTGFVLLSLLKICLKPLYFCLTEILLLIFSFYVG